eukprot:tig00020816_g14205.t1
MADAQPAKGELRYETRALGEPIKLRGPVVTGFRRGSKMLGIPTANLPYESFKDVIHDQQAGVYFGWASVNGGEVLKTVLSIGWNPYFKNTQKTVEPYIIHKFESDFYGQELKLLICGYLRPEADFPNLESLIAAIHNDIKLGEEHLEEPGYHAFKGDPFFAEPVMVMSTPKL